MAEDYFKQRRRVLRQRRWGGRMARCMMYAVIAEAFLIPLVPLAAMAVLLVGCTALFLRLRIDPSFHLRRLPYDAPALLFVIIGFLLRSHRIRRSASIIFIISCRSMP